MRSLIKIYLLIGFLPFYCFAQELTEIEYISPFHDGMAAVKKADSWGFINADGVLVVDFRTDMVLKEIDGEIYPVFNSGRCLIHKKEEGISYFGFIGSTGEIVIEPEFLNATHFDNELAIVLKLYKNILGRNDVLDKTMIDYNYMEVVIDTNGKIVHYLFEEPVHITLSRDFMKSIPEIKSRFLSSSIYAVRTEDDKWSIQKM